MSNSGAYDGATLRDGHVSSYDADTHTARVVFDDLDDMVSHPFPVILPNTLKNKDEIHLDAGEHVMCLCMGNGIESGVVLGCVYDKKNLPPTGDPDVRTTRFDDGTTMTMDRKQHIFEIKDSFGSAFKMADGYIDLKPAKKVRIKKGG
jgi:phage baseplate assembly protein gpV